MLSTLLCGPRSILIYFCPIGQSSSQLNLPSTPSFLPLGSFERGKNIILLFFCGHDPSFKSFRLHRILLFHFLNSTFEKFQISTKKTYYYFLLKILFKKYFARLLIEVMVKFSGECCWALDVAQRLIIWLVV